MNISGRKGGVLLHITSLPGGEPCGTLGKGAYRFVDFLASAGMKLWQVLPTGPVGYGESPYQSAGSCAGSPLMIDLKKVHEAGMLPEYVPSEPLETAACDFDAARADKDKWLRLAFAHEKARLESENAYAAWCARWPWLKDFAVFYAIKEEHHLQSWLEWPESELRLRTPEAMQAAEERLKDEIRYIMFQQYLFRTQWQALHEYANAHGILLLGDMPIYVAADSADVWANAEYFQLDKDRYPERVAGVPPDYFSEDGQLWGNPLYRWSKLKEDHYSFWINRLASMGELYDAVRIDHFIGFANYYSIPYGAPNARGGRWVIGPGSDFFAEVKKQLPTLSIVAENLGAVNDRVVRLLDYCGYPGMCVMQFGFDGGLSNPHNVASVVKNRVIYTGTHDNDTTLGWWQTRSKAEKAAIRLQLENEDLDDATIVPAVAQAAFDTVAETAVLPLQDALTLDSTSRMNTPGTLGAPNWQYRCRFSDLTPALAQQLRALNERTDRL